MPRIANEGTKVDAWAVKTGEGSSTFDLCIRCFRVHDDKPLPRKCEPYHTGEPRGIVMQIDGIDAEEAELNGYRCEVCNTKLTPRNY